MHSDLYARQTAPRASAEHAPSHGPVKRADLDSLVREALGANYVELASSPLCDMPGVVALARRHYAHKLYPAASAVRALLAQAYADALNELDGVEGQGAQRVATYLRLARDGLPVTEITQRLGLRSTSWVHHTIQRQAIALFTDAFVRRAGRTDRSQAGEVT